MALHVAGRVGPGAPLLEDPGGQPGGGVVQSVAEGLRARLLDEVVAALLPLPLRLHLGVRALGVARRSRVVADHRRREARHHRVHGDQPLGKVERQPAGDHRADVVPVGREAAVAEALHQLRPQRGHPAPGHPAGRRPVGEPEAGDRGHDHVEGIRGIAAVGSGVGEERDEGEHLDERAGPAMGDEERQRRWPVAPRVDEVDAETVHAGPEVGERVHRALLTPPVESRAPVLDDVPEVGEAGAVVPAGALDLVRPARAAEALPQVVERRLRNVDDEGARLHRDS